MPSFSENNRDRIEDFSISSREGAGKMSKISDEYDALIEEREHTYIMDFREPVIMKMIKLMTEDMTKTIDFLDHECTGDQFAWLSEIFEEIAEASQSHEFIAALRRAAKRYPEETKQFNIISFIDDAETYITD